MIFTEGILLADENPETNFSITPYNNPNEYLEIEKAEYEISDTYLKSIILTTKEQENEQNYIVTAGINIISLAGNPVISGVYDTGFFIGSDVLISDEEAAALTQELKPETTTETPDTPKTETGSITETTTEEKTTDVIAPEEIQNFEITITEKLIELNEYLLTLSWTQSINTAGDLIDQILYKSLNRGETYDSGISLGPNATKYETRLEGGKEYTFKITTKDRTGNESTGVIKSIRLPKLPDTGPAGMALFGILLSGLGARGIQKRRK